MSLRETWNAQAQDWIRFARTPGHDHAYERLNLPRFLELLPPPGQKTLDVGCGEGRLGGALVARGHSVVGVDTSAALVGAARDRHEALVADATSLPFADGSFDLALAFMSLHDMDEPAAAVREIARVLSRDGRFCLALEHPIASSGRFASRDATASFVTDSYLGRHRRDDVHERDGIRTVFAKQTGPLEWYTRMLEKAGLLIEAIREPAPTDDHVADRAPMSRWMRLPLFLHVRAVKP
ncbi:MAG: class I SAM-dependent methyltransferase [Gaiellaceae bacterium MAG52_C11]|nr:class I SAM-dependent methyltransferase [Candidatus Gaiellasilicea maunaloa]